jgi:RND superfamily putative drug exporter
MLAKLTRVTVARPKTILISALLLILICGGASSGITKRLTAGGYEERGAESHKAEQILEKDLGQGTPNLILMVTDRRGADDPAVTAAGQAITRRLTQEKYVTNVVSYWSLNHSPVLRDKAGDKALVVGRITGTFDQQKDRAKDLATRFSGTVDGVKVQIGGESMMWNENITAAQKDVSRAESVAFPLTMIILVLIFGSVMAALLPMAVSFVTIMVTTGLMFGLTFLIDTSNFVFNMAVFAGMGLAIDYSLLVVSRYREALRKGLGTDDAIMESITTAGRTVVFSAVTVAVAFTAVLVFPSTLIVSLAAAGFVAALAAAAGTVTVIPALLKLLGPRIEKWRPIKRKAVAEKAVESGFWHRTAVFVMHRPITVAALVIAFMVLLGSPVLNMKLRMPDEQVLPTSAQSAKVATALRTQFDTRETMPIEAVTANAGDSATGKINSYALRLSALPNVTRVQAATGTYVNGRQVAPAGPANAIYSKGTAGFLTVVPAVDGYSSQGSDLVKAVRNAPAPFDVKVGGPPAVSADSLHGLYSALPLAITILFLGMFILLFLLSGSVVLPLLGIVLTTISLSATLGAVVYIFQDGHLKWLVGDFVVTGTISWTVPITLFAMAFGLSMDYQVFMLSRIREEYVRSGDNDAAVAKGLERTGRIVTYAALLISIIFFAWITSGLSYMKAFGIGCPLAIFMDATLIRGTLLPAAMKLLGRANWWAPGPLRALHARFGISEAESSTVEAPPSVGATVP